MSGPLDPNKATRQQFTDNLCGVPCPKNASTDWRELFTKHQALLRALADHPAMQANLQQTYMAPAANKNSVYFAWDFVGRTLGGHLPTADPTLSKNGARQNNNLSDVLTRSLLISDLLLDTKPGMLKMMVDMTYPGQPESCLELGEDVLRATRELKAAA